jgi:hypothetical protein
LDAGFGGNPRAGEDDDVCVHVHNGYVFG